VERSTRPQWPTEFRVVTLPTLLMSRPPSVVADPHTDSQPRNHFKSVVREGSSTASTADQRGVNHCQGVSLHRSYAVFSSPRDEVFRADTLNQRPPLFGDCRRRKSERGLYRVLRHAMMQRRVRQDSSYCVSQPFFIAKRNQSTILTIFNHVRWAIINVKLQGSHDTGFP